MERSSGQSRTVVGVTAQAQVGYVIIRIPQPFFHGFSVSLERRKTCHNGWSTRSLLWSVTGTFSIERLDAWNGRLARTVVGMAARAQVECS